MFKKIYTKIMRCSFCRKPIEEYSKDNRTRTLRAWRTICMSCCKQFYKIQVRLTEQEKRIVRLEQNKLK